VALETIVVVLVHFRIPPVVLLLAVCIGASAEQATQNSRPLPDPVVLTRQIREAIRLDYALQKEFTYREHRRDVKISTLGKVTVGPLRTFEVFPSTEPGKTYKRLIAVDGKPLDPAELAKRDAERQRDLARLETEAERAARTREEEAERREREAIIDDAMAVFAPTLIGREIYEGQPVIVAGLSARPNARVTTREGRWFRQFEGRAWIAEADYQIARIDMHAIDDVSIGWGIVGRIHQGSRFVFSRRKVEDTWLPAELIFEGSGRTLLFRKFQLNAVTTYSDYRRQTKRNGLSP
jgi:hypothetical protein